MSASDAAAGTGKQVYFERYLPAFNQIAARSEATRAIRPAFIGPLQTQLIGPTDETWDDVALIEYPSFAAFRAVAESEACAREASPHRQAALADWRLIALVQQVAG